MAEKNAKTVGTVEHNPEHGSSFPPFQSENFPSQLFWFAIVFIALYLLMSRIALPRMTSIVQGRRLRVEADLAEAERLREESAKASAAYEQSLADARTRAQALAAGARQEEAAAAEAARKDTDAKLNARIAAAGKDIRARQAAAMNNVRAIGVDAATAILERLIGRAPARPEVESAVADALEH
jgi:F-type H+-transporting ATPase subunit b